ncbi:MAG: ribbon-helix-helix protein, CopG family [Spirochaetaceae bacterium]|nr:ribbon-helix-helix protein, CopG family [Spirochaetaceae bacterium]
MIRTQVQVTEQQMRRLKRLAADRDVSVAELVRSGVDSILDAAEQESQSERERRALAALGRFRSGRSDVSREHDRYLAESYARLGEHER